MRIEKVNEDKIRIFFNLEDLKAKNIDFQSFMANSAQSQELFLNLLDEAEKEVGFVTKNYKIMIEALATMDGTFVLNVTRIIPEGQKEKLSRKMNIKRKLINIDKDTVVYSFSSFDDFCNFCNSIKGSIYDTLDQLSKYFSLYEYKKNYYLIIKKIHLDYCHLKDFYLSITEFSHILPYSDLFERKLLEYGKLIIKNDAIKTCIKHFA